MDAEISLICQELESHFVYQGTQMGAEVEREEQEEDYLLPFLSRLLRKLSLH
jgi:hypothetical protein